MSEWKLPVRQVTETVAKIEQEIADSVAAWTPKPRESVSEFIARKWPEPIILSEADMNQLRETRIAAVSKKPDGGYRKGEGYTWHDRCSIRSDNKLRCVYVKDHDYPCRFDIGTGG